MNKPVIQLRVFFERMLRKIGGKPAGYFRIGRCRRCGACCRDLVLNLEGRKIKDMKQFESLVEEDPRYGIFSFKGESPDGTLIFYCTRLDEDTNRCSIYGDRPAVCVDYPDPDILRCGGDVIEGCGFYLVPPFDFKDVLKSQ